MAEQDFRDRLMNDMDPTLLDFIKNKVNTFIKWDIVKFFFQNPHTTDTAQSIARYIGREIQAVEPDLEALAIDELVIATLLDDTKIYTYTNNQAIQALVTQFMIACQDRHFRVKMVYHILHRND